MKLEYQLFVRTFSARKNILFHFIATEIQRRDLKSINILFGNAVFEGQGKAIEDSSGPIVKRSPLHRSRPLKNICD